MKLNRGVVLIAFCAITTAGSAHAGLLGDTVQCEFNFPFACRSTATVSEGPEFTVLIGVRPPHSVFSADFDDTGLTLTNIDAAGSINFAGGNLPNQYFHFQDLTDPLVMATLVSSGGVSGFTSSNITLTSGDLTLYVGDTFWDAGASIRVGLVTESQQVPEPATLALFGLGLAGVALARRRRGIAPGGLIKEWTAALAATARAVPPATH